MQQLCHFSFKAMGSPCQLQFYADSNEQANELYQSVVSQIEQLEQRYSRFRPDSLITKINQRAGTGRSTLLDPETRLLLHYAEQCYQESEGLFDVTSGVLNRLWHIDNQQIPSDQAIEQLLPQVGWDKVEWDEQKIYLPLSGMQLDFGGIVKEYAADTAANICLKHPIHSGIVELGGDVRVIGPLPDGQGWPIGIADPHGEKSTIAQIRLTQGALASSGDYERYLEIDGKRYSHLLNPKTGRPISAMRATSVIADQCIVAGSLATIAMLKAEQGQNWLEQLGQPYLCYLANNQVINQLTM